MASQEIDISSAVGSSHRAKSAGIEVEVELRRVEEKWGATTLFSKASKNIVVFLLKIVHNSTCKMPEK